MKGWCTRLGTWQIDEVRRVDLARVLRKIGQDNGPAAADHTLGIIRAVLNWHALNDENYRPPSLRELTLTPDEQKSRTRFLSHPEIRSLWKAKIAAPWGPFSKFLLLTACRRSEAAEATWGEIRDGTWIIPASRYKTKTEMRFPLSRAALDVLASLPRIHGSDFIFTTDGTRPLSAFTEGKQNIDKASRVVGWTFHDLRRTARTLLSEIRVDPDVAERCLGHKIAGIRGTYDIHKYESEMLHAFEALATQIERVANPQENVVVMGAGR